VLPAGQATTDGAATPLVTSSGSSGVGSTSWTVGGGSISFTASDSSGGSLGSGLGTGASTDTGSGPFTFDVGATGSGGFKLQDFVGKDSAAGGGSSSTHAPTPVVGAGAQVKTDTSGVINPLTGIKFTGH
jgi:hypothetical protein